MQALRRDFNSRLRRAGTPVIFLFIGILLASMICYVPEAAYANFKANLRAVYEHHLSFSYDGPVYGNDQASDEIMYVVARTDSSRPGRIDLKYYTASNTLYVDVDNIKSLTIYARTLFADNSLKVFGALWLRNSNFYKQYFMEKGVFHARINTTNPIAPLIFTDVPQPTRVVVNGALFSNYTYLGSGSFSSSITEPKTDVDMWFTSIGPGIPPVARIFASRTNVNTGELIEFNGTRSYDPDGTITEYVWDFGDGNYSYGAIVTHAYATYQNVTYGVILLVKDNEGLVNTTTVYVDVNRPDRTPPIADAGENATVLQDEYYFFDASNSWDNRGIVNYSWYFGDGATGYGLRVRHRYSALGNYHVTLVVRDEAGYSSSDTITMTVINVIPTADAGADIIVAENVPAVLDGSLSTDSISDRYSLTYYWDFGDGTGEWGKTVSHLYPDAGEYTATLTVTDPHGAKSEDKVRVTVTNVPPEIEPIPDQIASQNQIFRLKIIAHDGRLDTLTYTLTNTAMLTIDSVTGEIIYLPREQDVGHYRICVRVTDRHGAWSERTFNLTVSMNRAPRVVKLLPDIELNSGETKNVFNLDNHFKDADGDRLTYSYYGNTHVSVRIDGVHNVFLTAPFNWNGTEQITFVGRDGHGASAEDTISVTVYHTNRPPVFRSIPDQFVKFNFTFRLSIRPFVEDENLSNLICYTNSIFVQPEPQNMLELKILYTDRNIEKERVRITVSDGEYTVSQEFNITVIFEQNWWPPVLKEGKKLPDVAFKENTVALGVFNLNDYFQSNFSPQLNFTCLPVPHIFVKIHSNGSVDLWAERNWSGGGRLVFKAEDEKGAWVADDTNITVIFVNQPPVVIQQVTFVSVPAGEVWKINLTHYFYDCDTPTLIYSVNTNRIKIDPLTGIASWQPAPDELKLEGIRITATDGEFNATLAEFSITVVVEKQVYNVWLIALAAVLGVFAVIGSLSIIYRYRIDELFLVNNAGLLLAHLSRRSELELLTDKDILSGMLTAVQSFVQDTFRREGEAGKKEALETLQYGDFKIVIEHGLLVYLAAIIRGYDTRWLRWKLRRYVARIERTHDTILKDWDGNLKQIAPIKALLQPLIRRGRVVEEEEKIAVPAKPVEAPQPYDGTERTYSYDFIPPMPKELVQSYEKLEVQEITTPPEMPEEVPVEKPEEPAPAKAEIVPPEEVTIIPKKPELPPPPPVPAEEEAVTEPVTEKEPVEAEAPKKKRRRRRKKKSKKSKTED